MIHNQIAQGLTQLGHVGWVLSGDDYENIVWTSDAAKPSLKDVLKAASEAEAAVLTAKQAILNKLGLTADELKIIFN